jgi:WD40 repeat protein
MSPDAQVWAVSQDARTVALRSLDAGTPGADVAVPTLPLESGEQIRYLTFSRDGGLLFANLADGDVSTATVAIRVSRSGAQVTVGAVSRLDGQEALTSSGDGTRVAFRSLDSQLDPPHSEVVVRDSGSLAEVWRTRTTRLPDDGLAAPEDVFALDRDGTRLAGTYEGGRVVVWRQQEDGATPGRLFAPDLGETDPRNPRYGVAFSPDGDHLAANGPDLRLRLFDLSDAGDSAARTRALPAATANRVRYSDDGTLILVDGIVLLDARTLDQVGPRLHPAEWTNQVDRGTQATSFTPDGRYVVAERVDGSQVARFEVGLGLMRATACRLAGRHLTPQEQGAFQTGPASGTMCPDFPPDGG